MFEIAKELIEKRSDLFPNLNTDLIICGLRVDKEAPERQKGILKIDGVRGHRTLLSEKKYIIYGYKSTWDELSKEKKIAHVASMLKCMDVPTPEELAELISEGENFEYGKIQRPDISDWKTFIEKFGTDWPEEYIEVPNIIEDKSIKI